MPETKNITFRIKDISVLKFSINNDPNINVEKETFNFLVNIRTFAKPSEKTFALDVILFIKNNSQVTLCEMVNRFVFEITNFDEFVNFKTNEEVQFPIEFVHSLIGISISTTRGILFSKTEGSRLGSLYLPVMNPTKFVLSKIEDIQEDSR